MPNDRELYNKLRGMYRAATQLIIEGKKPPPCSACADGEARSSDRCLAVSRFFFSRQRCGQECLMNIEARAAAAKK